MQNNNNPASCDCAKQLVKSLEESHKSTTDLLKQAIDRLTETQEQTKQQLDQSKLKLNQADQHRWNSDQQLKDHQQTIQRLEQELRRRDRERDREREHERERDYRGRNDDFGMHYDSYYNRSDHHHRDQEHARYREQEHSNNNIRDTKKQRTANGNTPKINENFEKNQSLNKTSLDINTLLEKPFQLTTHCVLTLLRNLFAQLEQLSVKNQRINLDSIRIIPSSLLGQVSDMHRIPDFQSEFSVEHNLAQDTTCYADVVNHLTLGLKSNKNWININQSIGRLNLHSKPSHDTIMRQLDIELEKCKHNHIILTLPGKYGTFLNEVEQACNHFIGASRAAVAISNMLNITFGQGIVEQASQNSTAWGPLYYHFYVVEYPPIKEEDPKVISTVTSKIEQGSNKCFVSPLVSNLQELLTKIHIAKKKSCLTHDKRNGLCDCKDKQPALQWRKRAPNVQKTTSSSSNLQK